MSYSLELLLSLWKWSSIDDNLYDWPFMVFNFLFYIYLFIRCIKLEENFENFPCEKICQIKWQNFFLLMKTFTDGFFFFTGEYFLATNWHEDFNPKFESKLFWNYFSCRLKVPGNLTAKSDYEFTVKGIQIIQKITNKKVAYGLKRLLNIRRKRFWYRRFCF